MGFKVSLTIQHRDLGARKLAGKVKLITKKMAPKVAVGVLGRGNAHVAMYAAVNELGREDESIPPRPFMRPAFSSSKVRRAFDKLEGYLKDEVTLDQMLNHAGQVCRNEIIANINRHPPPPNAPSTIARKGSTGTLVHTGLMKQKISYEIRKPGSRKGQ